MKNCLLRFITNDDGAVTVDWVVLTAAIIGLNVFALVNYIEGGLEIAGYSLLSSVLEASNDP